jgi:YidC/Oxa1 family membrane protein insertase
MFNSDQKRAFIAVILSGLVLFGWQFYFAPKQVNTPQDQSTSKVATTSATSTAQPQPELSPAKSASANTTISTPPSLTNYSLKNGDFVFSLNNDLSVSQLKNPNSVFSFNSLSDTDLPLKIQLLTDAAPVDVLFSMEKNGDNKVIGTNANYGINFSAVVAENGKVNLALNSSKPYKYRFIFAAKPKKLDNGQLRHFSIYSNEVKTVEVSKEKDGDASLKWFGLDFNYHMFMMVFKDKVVSKYKTNDKGELIVDMANPVSTLSSDLVFTKKNYDTLLSLGDNLHLAVDFGFFAVLAVPILRGLQFIHNYIPNYGIAIILLTILIRLITFPLQYKSFKSMKKMQTIQPELNKIKEKYKDEPQKMQKETMELFKKAGANPLSGCLPLLLQMPFFFAIYRVLYSAVELVGAPFYGWIHDLSIHDPYYVLPILMGFSMLAQQKLTPQTSMDPTQQKIMLFMPVIFAFIMKSLPAGLVLYIFVSTVVGIAQQAIVYKMAD